MRWLAGKLETHIIKCKILSKMSFAIIWKAELELMKQVGQESVGKSTCVCVFDTTDCIAQGTTTKK